MPPSFPRVWGSSTLSSADLLGSQSGHGGGREAGIRSSYLHQGGGGGCVERRWRIWKVSAIKVDDDGVGGWKEAMINNDDEACKFW